MPGAGLVSRSGPFLLLDFSPFILSIQALHFREVRTSLFVALTLAVLLETSMAEGGERKGQ